MSAPAVTAPREPGAAGSPSSRLPGVREPAAAAELLARAVIAAPDRIVFAALMAAIPTGLAAVFHEFHRSLVIPLALLAVVVSWPFTPSQFLRTGHPRVPGDRGSGTVTDRVGAPRVDRAVAGSIAALAISVVWVLLNRHYTSENLAVSRDPDFITLHGLWLSQHSSPVLDSNPEAAMAGGLPGVSLRAVAFDARDNQLYVQGLTLLPALLAVGGWGAGLRGVLVTDLLIGAVGLLAVYGFARRLLGPVWALLPMTLLAACMPMVYFSRGTFTEIVSLVGVFGGLTLLFVAFRTGRLAVFGTAGLAVGVSFLARIDGGVTGIGVLVGFGLVTLGARSPRVRRRAALGAAAFVAGCGVLDAVSLWDGWHNSPFYLSSEWHGIKPLLVFSVVGAVVVIGIAFAPLGPVRAWIATGGRRFRIAVTAVTGLVALAMIARPLFWTARGHIVATLTTYQRAAGLPVDDTRSYDESTVNWLAMYLGWPVVVLAGLGAALLVGRFVQRRDPVLGVFLATVGCVGLLYLDMVSISPDQIWAMRRFVPVVIPGLLVAATWPLTRFARRVPRTARMLSGPVLVVLLAGVTLPWSGTFFTTAWGGQANELNADCAVVAGRPVILVGKEQVGPAAMLPTFKVGCEVPAIYYDQPTTAGLLALQQRFLAGYQGRPGAAPLVVTFDVPDGDTSLPWAAGVPAPRVSATISRWNQTVQTVPRVAGPATRKTYFATITATGRLAGLAGPTAQVAANP